MVGINKLEDLRLQQFDIMILKLSPNLEEFLLRFHKDLERVPIDTDMCFGDVIKCMHFSDEFVAIKILTFPQDQINNGIPSTILNHVSLLKGLNHPNIVRLLQILVNEEVMYLIFYHVNLNLERYITNPMLSIGTFETFILRQALSGLAYLHSHNIVHTDINPFNVLFQYHLDESPPVVKLCGMVFLHPKLMFMYRKSDFEYYERRYYKELKDGFHKFKISDSTFRCPFYFNKDYYSLSELLRHASIISGSGDLYAETMEEIG